MSDRDKETGLIVLIFCISFVLMNLGYLRTINKMQKEISRVSSLYNSCINNFESGGIEER